MTKKCKFEVEVTYNSDYFAEGEIQETIKNAIRDLNVYKEKQFGRRTMCDSGKTNHGITAKVTQCSEFTTTYPPSLVETLVSLRSSLDESDSLNKVLSAPKLEELMAEVRIAFRD